jgi:small subunit ribosomal protein S16
LRRTGKKKQPSYRIVVADSRAPRDGDFVETLGTYNPRSEPSVIVLDEERAKHWLDRGAQPSDRVWKILAIQGIAEIPAKLQTRIALGAQRAEEAKKAKPKEDAAPAAETPAAVAEAESSAQPDVPSAEAESPQETRDAAPESPPTENAEPEE